MDASLLSDIAYRAKQYWGYPDEWMTLWKEDLRVTPHMIHEHAVWKIMAGESIAGYAIIVKLDTGYEVEHCFVAPEFMGKGYGTTLLKYIFGLDPYRHQPFTVLSDPHALRFYEKFGFKTIKQIPSKPEGRTLPLMQMING